MRCQACERALFFLEQKDKVCLPCRRDMVARWNWLMSLWRLVPGFERRDATR